MKRNHIFSLIGLIVIVLIVLAIALPGKEKKEKQAAQEAVTFSDPETFAGEGDMVYSFDGIQWDLDLIEAGSARVPETRVGFFFENFTRRADGIPAVFGNPFHLGFYKGDCVEIETLDGNDSFAFVEGSFISGISCVWEEENTFVLLAQNQNMVTAYEMIGSDAGVLNTVREIDITKIVE